MTTVLALDLASSTGWACGVDSGKPRSGVWLLGLNGQHGHYFSALAARLEDAIATLAPSLIIAEAPLPPQRMSSSTVARVLIGLIAVAEMIAYERSVKFVEASCSDARQMVLGRPRVPKSAVVAWCRDQGWRPADDNAADALLLLRYQHILLRSRVMA